MGVLISEEGAQAHEVQIRWHKQNGVPRVVLVKFVPNLLGEERESGIIHMLYGLDVG